MVVNEKALVRGMKDAFKAGGYTVAAGEDGTLAIYNARWAVQMEEKNIPREVLSLLALHMGYLPKKGDAYKVFKGDKVPVVQNVVHAVAVQPVDSMAAKAAVATAASSALGRSEAQIHRTGITFQSYRAWQRPSDMQVVLVDPEAESIFRKKEKALLIDGAIYQEGRVSRAYVWAVDREYFQIQVEYLSGMQWTGK